MKKYLLFLILVLIFIVLIVLGIVIAINSKYISDIKVFQSYGCNISDGFWLAKVVKNEGSVNLCEKIKTQQCKNLCIGFAAAYAKSPEICEKILKESAKDYYAECLTKVALETKNIEVCKKIPAGRVSGELGGKTGYPFQDMCFKILEKEGR